MSAIISNEELSKYDLPLFLSKQKLQEIKSFKMKWEKSPEPFYMIDTETHKGYSIIPFEQYRALTGNFPNHFLRYKLYNNEFIGKPRNYQNSIIEESLFKFRCYRSVLLNVYTSAGKSFIAVLLAWFTNLRTLIITPRRIINKGWRTTIEKIIPEARVWYYDEKWDPECRFLISTDLSVITMDSEILNTVGCVIIDEVPLVCTKNKLKVWQRVFPQYLILCSATLERDDELHKMALLSINENSIVVRKNPIPFNVYSLQLSYCPQIKKNRFTGYDSFPDYINEVVKCEELNRSIIDIVRLNYLTHKIAVFTMRNNEKDKITGEIKPGHARQLYDYFNQSGYNVALLSGEIERYVDARLLIVTVSKASIGFDEENTAINFGGQKIDLIILASYGYGGKYGHGLQQLKGRADRSEIPVIIDLSVSCDIAKKHRIKRLTWYLNNYGRIFHIERPIQIPQRLEIPAGIREITQEDIKMLKRGEEIKIEETSNIEDTDQNFSSILSSIGSLKLN